MVPLFLANAEPLGTGRGRPVLMPDAGACGQFRVADGRAAACGCWVDGVAVAIPDLGKATTTDRGIPGAKVSAPRNDAAHGVTVVLVELANAEGELLSPLGGKSRSKGVVQKNPGGGSHHLWYESDASHAAREPLKQTEARIPGDGEPKVGAHGEPVLRVIPRTAAGRWPRRSRRAKAPFTDVGHGVREAPCRGRQGWPSTW